MNEFTGTSFSDQSAAKINAKFYGTVALAIVVFIFCLIAPLGAQSREHVDAKAAFLERQETLVKLAGVIGALHHLRDICFPNEPSPKWRNRMKEVIALEHPIEDTQQQMIAAFNTRYQDTKRQFSYCSAEINLENYRLAREGEIYAHRLRADFFTDSAPLTHSTNTATAPVQSARSDSKATITDPPATSRATVTQSKAN